MHAPTDISPQNISTATTQSLFFDRVQRWPDRSRFMAPDGDGWRSITWGEYGEQVALITHALGALGLQYDDKVGLFSDNCPEWIYAGLGAMTARNVMVPIYHASTPEQLGYIIRNADLKLLFVRNQGYADALAACTEDFPELQTIVSFEGMIAMSDSAISTLSLEEFYDLGREYRGRHPGHMDELIGAVDMDDVAYMIYTSGTTGRPKGVPLSYRNLAVSTSDWVSINGPLIHPHSDDIHWLPNSHIYGWGAIGLGNLFGFCSYLGTPLNVLELLPQVRPHLFMSVPVYYEKLYLLAQQSSSNHIEQLESLRTMMGGRIQFCLSGGAGLKRAVKDFFLDAGMLVTEGYGLSECSPTLTMNRPQDFNFDSVGKPYPSVELRLAADGEIEARGPVVFKGYYKDPQATREAFTADGWFKTGDVGRWLEGGFLQIVDRKKDIIVTSGGKNVAPQSIEGRFADNPHIEHLVVYGDGQKYLVALVTLRPAAGADSPPSVNDPAIRALVQEQIDLVNRGLAPFETIKKFHLVQERFTPLNGLLTPALKLRRRAVHERYRAELEALYEPKTILQGI